MEERIQRNIFGNDVEAFAPDLFLLGRICLFTSFLKLFLEILAFFCAGPAHAAFCPKLGVIPPAEQKVGVVSEAAWVARRKHNVEWEDALFCSLDGEV